ncbi:hypothetical protein EDB92DRAFT_127755 [Lactarius akahatsu]|uniref:Uncharacterized protein n=1 Tax=Lactarius akahatsu TaxID=416441 RepID=A0AAD4L939_9AGAM|nr:hypothetical protein EDB92DRAFT_127755 [Lactarius akahatsu]
MERGRRFVILLISLIHSQTLFFSNLLGLLTDPVIHARDYTRSINREGVCPAVWLSLAMRLPRVLSCCPGGHRSKSFFRILASKSYTPADDRILQ